MRSVAWFGFFFLMTLWLVGLPHARCDPLNALPWLRC